MVDGEPVFNQEQLEKQIKVAEKIKEISIDFAKTFITNGSKRFWDTHYEKFIKENYTKYL